MRKPSISGRKVALVRRLYYEKLLAAPQIAKQLGVSLDAVYFCMRSNGFIRRTLTEENKIRFLCKPTSYRLKLRLTPSELRLKDVAVTLYWGEGYKAGGAHGVDFANSDPLMITVFLQFLRQVCRVDEQRLRVFLYCYANQKPEQLIDFWSQHTKIPKDQFTKPYVRMDFRKEKIGKMRHGLVHIRYCDKKLLQQFLEWIKEYYNTFSAGTQAVNEDRL